MKRQTLFCGLLLILRLTAYGQQTPEKLGASVFLAFQSKTLSDLDKFIPTADQTIQIAKLYGVNRSENELQHFRDIYPEKVKIFKNNCDTIFKSGINWTITKLDSVIKSQKEIQIAEDKPVKTMTATYLDIYFSSNNRKYIIRLRQVFVLEEKWYLGNSIKLEEVK